MLSEDDVGIEVEDWTIVWSSDFDGILVTGKMDGRSNDELSRCGCEWGSIIADINGSTVELAGEGSLGHGLAFSIAARAFCSHDHLIITSFGSLNFVSEDGGVLVTWGDLAIASESSIGVGAST